MPKKELIELADNEWTFLAPVGLIQSTSLLGRERTGFSKGTVPTSLILAHLVSFLVPDHLRRLPSPTHSVAGCPVAWLSPRFIGNIQPSDY